jgi:predicted flavoprotein YhiN
MTAEKLEGDPHETAARHRTGAFPLAGKTRRHVMPIPSVSETKIIEAMTQFDKELRTSPQWASWEDNQAHRYAIKHNGNLYPVKQIIAMATGVASTSFGGGTEANNYLKERAFEVVPLRAVNPSGVFFAAERQLAYADVAGVLCGGR